MPPVIELLIFERSEADAASSSSSERTETSIWRSSIYSGDGQKLILYLCTALKAENIDPFRECTLNGKQVRDLIRFCHDEFKTALPDGIDNLVSNESNYILLIDDW